MSCPIISSHDQNKEWRKTRKWYKDGKHNECEIYQRGLVESITKQQCLKSNMRINIISNIFENNLHPMKKEDGFEWSENFDGYISFQLKDIYFNLKMVCDAGGAQTRSLREVYHFIACQLKYLLSNKHDEINTTDISNVHFVNILDGNTCYTHKQKFIYLLNKPIYEQIKHKVFVGDMVQFQEWWIKLF